VLRPGPQPKSSKTLPATGPSISRTASKPISYVVPSIPSVPYSWAWSAVYSYLSQSGDPMTSRHFAPPGQSPYAPCRASRRPRTHHHLIDGGLGHDVVIDAVWAQP
jgi:hypothetical protein